MATVLQIEDFWSADRNPYYHTPEDTIAHMNLDYWEEQIKATVASAAHLAVPVESGEERVYLPIVLRGRLLTGESCLGHRVED